MWLSEAQTHILEPEALRYNPAYFSPAFLLKRLLEGRHNEAGHTDARAYGILNSCEKIEIVGRVNEEMLCMHKIWPSMLL
jgi:hypothetical protein